MKKIYSNKAKGFSLIELLVVVAIVAVLSAVVITSMTSSRQKARDAKRISDLAQIQLALEQFFDKCRRYPNGITLDSSNSNCSSLKLSTYISVIPKDPSSGASYEYGVDSNNLDYVLKATLESTNSATADGLSGTVHTLSCNPTSTSYCVGPK